MEATQPQDMTKATISQTSRLFVRNLPFSCTDEELATIFEPFGEISQVGVFFFASIICCCAARLRNIR